MIKKIVLLSILFFVLISPIEGRAHESHEETTNTPPLLRRAHIVLQAMKQGQEQTSFKEAGLIYADFVDPTSNSGTVETGLKETANRLDRRYGGKTGLLLEKGLKEKDSATLKKGLQTLSLLLMREKFDLVQDIFNTPKTNFVVQKMIFDLGKEYFAHMFVPCLPNPHDEHRLRKIINEMETSLDGRKVTEFGSLKDGLMREIASIFHLESPVRQG